MEIYNERVKDLLNPTKSNLKIREGKSRGIFVEDLSEWYRKGITGGLQQQKGLEA